MGWLRKRFGETNTQAGAAMILGAAAYMFPQYQAVIAAVAAVVGAGGVVTPDTHNQIEQR